MKKIFAITLGLSLFLCNQISAQILEKERGISISAMFGLTQRHYLHGTSFGIEKDKYTGPIINPRVGYRFNKKWEAGLLFRYEKFGEYSNYYGIGGFGEYNYLRFNNGIKLFVDMQAIYSIQSGGYGADNDNPDCYSNINDNITEIGFVPGVAYNIPQTPVDIKLRYLFVGFNHSSKDYKADTKGCLGRGDFILDGALRRLEIGLSVTF